MGSSFPRTAPVTSCDGGGDDDDDDEDNVVQKLQLLLLSVVLLLQHPLPSPPLLLHVPDVLEDRSIRLLSLSCLVLHVALCQSFLY